MVNGRRRLVITPLRLMQLVWLIKECGYEYHCIIVIIRGFSAPLLFSHVTLVVCLAGYKVPFEVPLYLRCCSTESGLSQTNRPS